MKGGKKPKRRRKKKETNEDLEIIQPSSPLLTTRSCGYKASQLASSFADGDGGKVDGTDFNSFTEIYAENDSSESDSCYSDCFSHSDLDGERGLFHIFQKLLHIFYFFSCVFEQSLTHVIQITNSMQFKDVLIASKMRKSMMMRMN